MSSAGATLDRLAPGLFVFLWSTGFIGAKLALPHAEPLTFLLARYAIVIVLMGSLALGTGARWPSGPTAILHVAVSGVLVHAVYLGGVFVAISRGLPAGVTSLVVGLQPILTAVGAGLLLGERTSRRQWTGLLLGFAGVAMVLSGKLGAAASVRGPGQVAPAVVALAGITAGTLYQKAHCPVFDLRAGAVIQFVAALIVTLPFAAATEAFRLDFTPALAFALGWLVLVLSVAAISLLNVLIRHGTAVHVARLFFLVPPTTSLIAFAVFGETLRGLALVGMGVAVAGVYLARSASPAGARGAAGR